LLLLLAPSALGMIPPPILLAVALAPTYGSLYRLQFLFKIEKALSSILTVLSDLEILYRPDRTVGNIYQNHLATLRDSL
jgi:hypothetical protein